MESYSISPSLRCFTQYDSLTQRVPPILGGSIHDAEETYRVYDDIKDWNSK